MNGMREHNSIANEMFIERWSSRKYDGSTLTQNEINTLMEAARFAPSSYNEQPWLFYYGKTKEEKKAMFDLLSEGNRGWVQHAGFFGYIVSKRAFTKTKEHNKNYAFDAGSAWMSLALQAHLMGLNAHGMSGFDHDAVYDVLGVNKDEYEVLAAFAVGRVAKKDKETEERTPRKSIEEITRGAGEAP